MSSSGVGAGALLRRYARRSSWRADLPAPEDAETYRVADVLLRLGDQLLAAGAATVDVEASMIAAAGAMGLPRAEVDITFNAITVTLVRAETAPPVTRVRVVRARSGN